MARQWRSLQLVEEMPSPAPPPTASAPKRPRLEYGPSAQGYRLPEAQAQAIPELRSQRLTGLEQDKIVGGVPRRDGLIADRCSTSSAPSGITAIIGDDLFGHQAAVRRPRRSEVVMNTAEINYRRPDRAPRTWSSPVPRGYFKRQAA